MKVGNRICQMLGVHASVRGPHVLLQAEHSKPTSMLPPEQLDVKEASATHTTTYAVGWTASAKSWAYYGALLYGGLCMAVFLVRTIKRIMFAEARNYGRDLTATNYLLLSLALFQFPFAFWLTSVRIPALAVLLKDVFPHAVDGCQATALLARCSGVRL
eukprot:gene15554-21650_t